MSHNRANNRAVLGLDVGGANLKAAHTSGFTSHIPFALWRNPGELTTRLRALLAEAPPYDALALTMTGELCDCFESKRQGVASILESVTQVSSSTVRVWSNEGTFLDAASAAEQPLKLASANWLALATFAGRLAPRGAALLIDVGTTTTDIIPLLDGVPVPRGRTDPERLRSYELVYRGWRRTPLCVLMDDGAAELFATTHDLCLVLRLVPEDPDDRETADGQPATREAAMRRLARMICADLETTFPRDRRELAEMLHQRFVSRLALAAAAVAQRLPSPVQTVIGSGSGEFLIPAIFRCPAGTSAFGPPFAKIELLSLAERLGSDVSAVACAYAVAILCEEKDEG
jgi:probable H4MPT-linked C1 transfer pathway protein